MPPSSPSTESFRTGVFKPVHGSSESHGTMRAVQNPVYWDEVSDVHQQEKDNDVASTSTTGSYHSSSYSYSADSGSFYSTTSQPSRSPNKARWESTEENKYRTALLNGDLDEHHQVLVWGGKPSFLQSILNLRWCWPSTVEKDMPHGCRSTESLGMKMPVVTPEQYYYQQQPVVEWHTPVDSQQKHYLYVQQQYQQLYNMQPHQQQQYPMQWSPEYGAWQPPTPQPVTPQHHHQQQQQFYPQQPVLNSPLPQRAQSKHLSWAPVSPRTTKPTKTRPITAVVTPPPPTSQASPRSSLVRPSTVARSTTVASSPKRTMGKPPLLSRRGVSAPGYLAHKQSPLQTLHKTNPNHANTKSPSLINKPPRRSSSKNPPSNAATQSPTVPPPLLNRPRTNTTDSASSMHRRRTGSFAFSVSSLSAIMGRAAVAPVDKNSRADFPATIEYNQQPAAVARMSSLSSTTSNKISPPWSPSSWEEPADDAESLLLSSDDDEETLGDSNGTIDQSLDCITPAEGEESDLGRRKEAKTEHHETQPKQQPNDWMLAWAQQGCTTDTTDTTPTGTIPDAADAAAGSVVAQPERKNSTIASSPLYMPVYNSNHAATNSNVILSGWAAVSTDDSLLDRLENSNDRPVMDRSDLALVELTSEGLVMKRGGLVVERIALTADYQVWPREECIRAGKCIVLCKHGKIVCTILPVSLPRQLFTASGDDLVDARKFAAKRSCLFTPFKATPAVARRTATSDLQWGQQEYCVRHYAPDEQHDTARHLQFAIDSVIRQYRVFQHTEK